LIELRGDERVLEEGLEEDGDAVFVHVYAA
jgi:hypothetical protein